MGVMAGMRRLLSRLLITRSRSVDGFFLVWNDCVFSKEGASKVFGLVSLVW
jgi:hypothetical protein